MDEPLSNLDAKLRVQMRTEVSRLQKRLGDDDGLRHARPDRGDDARRPRRGHARGRAAAGRHAARALQQPGQPLRRGLHRLAGDELLLRRRSSGGKLKLPFAEIAGAARASRTPATSSSASAPRTSRTRASRRPATTPGVEFDAPIEVVESMGSEIYVLLLLRGRRGRAPTSSPSSRATRGIAETPSGGAGLAVARLNPESEIERGRRRRSSGSTARSCTSSTPRDGSNLRQRQARDQEAAAEATRGAVEAEADEPPRSRAAAEQDAPPRAEPPDARGRRAGRALRARVAFARDAHRRFSAPASSAGRSAARC